MTTFVRGERFVFFHRAVDLPLFETFAYLAEAYSLSMLHSAE
jgi:hypothetical protein